MILSAIAAMAKNRVIGKNNQLPWHAPEDLKYFKEKTKGRILIMGRKTFESLPKPLPGRFHIVISRKAFETAQVVESKSGQECFCLELKKKPDSTWCAVVTSLNQAIHLAEQMVLKSHPYHRPEFGEEVFVCGGSEIYEQTLDHLDRLYLTVIDGDYDGDAHFPEFENRGFRLTESHEGTESPKAEFRIYSKRPKG